MESRADFHHPQRRPLPCSGPAGTFIGGNNELALALVMAIPLIRYLHLQETRKLFKIGLASAMVLTGVAAIGSQSRGGLVAMAAMGCSCG